MVPASFPHVVGLVKCSYRADVETRPVATKARVEAQLDGRGQGSYNHMSSDPDAWSVTRMDEQIVNPDGPQTCQNSSILEEYAAPFHIVVQVVGSDTLVAQPPADAVRDIHKLSVTLRVSVPGAFPYYVVVEFRFIGGVAEGDYDDGVAVFNAFRQGNLAMGGTAQQIRRKAHTGVVGPKVLCFLNDLVPESGGVHERPPSFRNANHLSVYHGMDLWKYVDWRQEIV